MTLQAGSAKSTVQTVAATSRLTVGARRDRKLDKRPADQQHTIRLSIGLLDQLEQRILSSQPDSDLHQSEDCSLCLLEELRVYGLSRELELKARRILHSLRSR